MLALALLALGAWMLPAEAASVGSGGDKPQVRTAKPRSVDNSRAPTPRSSSSPPTTARRTRPPKSGDSGGGSSRDRGQSRSSSRHGHYRPGGHGYFYPGYGSYYYGHYYPYYYRYPYRYTRWGYSAYSDYSGALDLNVYPKKVEVYLNGQHVGRAGRFDGFPGHLWLEEGKYELIFYRDGFQTEVREAKVIPGLVIDVSVEMAPGEARPPEELSSPPPWPRPRDGDRTARSYRRRAAPPEEPPSEDPRGAEGEEALDVRGEPARLFLLVMPVDASVYLDGRFLGTGEDLGRLRAGLIVDPGTHQLSVVRPGREAEEVEFRVEAGKDIELEVSLGAAKT